MRFLQFMPHRAETLFVHVVEAGSFKKTAERLGVEPSSVSRRIAALEKQLNVRLLNRSTRHTRPTELGQRYYEGISRILEEQSALEERISTQVGVLSGTFRVGAPVDFGTEFVVPVLRSLQRDAPDFKPEIWLGTRHVDLIEEDFDVVIRIGELADSSLVAAPLGLVSRVLVASPDYLERHGTPDAIADLSAHEFLFYTRKQARSDIEFNDGTLFPHARLRGSMTVNSVTALRRLVRQGAGMHLGPRWAFRNDMEAGTIVRVLPDAPLKGFPVNAVYPARAFLPRKTRRFIDQLRNALDEAL